MTFLSRLLRQPARPDSSQPPTLAGGERDATRRELLAMAVRDTLRRNGIPPGWISAEATPSVTARRQRGLHLRLVLKEWQPALPAYVVALQKAVVARLQRLDPLACEWLSGVSWKFEPADDSPCPPLPAPDFWAAAPAPLPPGPPSAAPDPRGKLKRLFDERDAAFRERSGPEFSSTLPMLMPERRLPG